MRQALSKAWRGFRQTRRCSCRAHGHRLVQRRPLGHGPELLRVARVAKVRAPRVADREAVEAGFDVAGNSRLYVDSIRGRTADGTPERVCS